MFEQDITIRLTNFVDSALEFHALAGKKPYNGVKALLNSGDTVTRMVIGLILKQAPKSD